MQRAEYTLKVRDIVLGEGMPKICIPLVGKDEAAIMDQARAALKEPCHLIEWRADWFEGVDDAERFKIMLADLREELGEVPLLMTFRTAAEGGEKEITYPDYRELLLLAASTGMTDLIDVEAFFDAERTPELTERLKEKGVRVILSNHNFSLTPSSEEMLERLCSMQDMGGDVVKLAVMPETEEDMFRLMQVTRQFTAGQARVPVITMSMGRAGLLSRIGGRFTGSCLSFGSAGQTSAPGQIPAGELNQILSIIQTRS